MTDENEPGNDHNTQGEQPSGGNVTQNEGKSYEMVKDWVKSRDWPKLSLRKLLQQPVPIFWILLVLFLISLYAIHTPDVTHEGIIKVDSPEVYSRERLVNDRFTQRFWLDEQLKNTPKVLANQAATTRENSSNIVAVINPGSVPSGSEVNVAAKAEKQLDENRNAPPAKASPIDSFRELLAYREEIRGEIMETLLDDRHDLKGNTLYRLKFDATLIPMSNNRDWALVDVVFSRGSYRADDTEKLYKEWLEQLNKELGKEFRNLKKAFIHHTMMEDDLSRFLAFLQGQPSHRSGGNHQTLKLKETIATKTQKGRKQVYASLGICDKNNPDFETQLACIETLSSKLHLDDASYFWIGGKNMNIAKQSRYEGARSLIRSHACGRFSQGHALFSGASSRKVLNQPEFLGCVQWREAVEEVYGDIHGLWKNIYEISEECHGEEKSKKYKSHAHCHSQKTNEKPAVSTARGMLAKLYEREQRLLEKTLAAYITARITAELNDVVTIEERCELGTSDWNCSLLVKPKLVGRQNDTDNSNETSITKFYKKLNCPDVTPTSSPKNGFFGSLPFAFFAADKEPSTEPPCPSTSRSKQVFAYVITPKESVQRISALQQSVESLQGTIGTAGADIPAVAQWTKQLKKITDHIQRQPIVVGFSNYSSEENHHVGWLLGPKIYTSKRNDIESRHTPIQNALAVLISMPSWWRTLQVTVTSCWVEDDSSILGETFSGHRSCTDEEEYERRHYSIRLPGNASEINRRLGYQISRTPNIKIDQTNRILGTFCAGQKATLLIEGSELWRSTAVTLGSQKADRIEVLPNMKAILATFGPVEALSPPPSRQHEPADDIDKKPSKLPVVVWTSEGRTLTYDGYIHHGCPSPKSTEKKEPEKQVNNTSNQNQ